MTTSIIEKIGDLLNHAERAGTEAERDAYFQKVGILARKYEIDLELARQATVDKQKREQPTQKIINIGEPRKPLNAVFCQLFMDIGKPHDLKFNVAHNSTYVVAFGMPSDIEMAEALYAVIVPQMVRAADEFIRGGTWKGDTTWDPNTWQMKPVHARVARRCFYEAYSSRIRARLDEGRRNAEAEVADHFHNVVADDTTGDTVEWMSKSTALVLQEKALEVSDFYDRTSTARGSWGGNRNTYTSSTGRSSGRRAANSAQLHGRKAIG